MTICTYFNLMSIYLFIEDDQNEQNYFFTKSLKFIFYYFHKKI